MRTQKSRILLAEDDYSLAFMIRDALEGEGFLVIYCRDGKEAVERYDKKTIDLCLLDIMMPYIDGIQVAKKIRQQSDQVPILFFSTKNQPDDKLKGYVTGADDYITKPFNMQELLFKIEVFLRRTQKMHASVEREYKFGTIRFSYTAMKIFYEDGFEQLTQKEADLLLFFCEHINEVVRREEVLRSVWGKEDFFLGRSMDVYITKLRKYLRPDPAALLETIHGIGYRFSIKN